jgi:1-pyrroline-4-hydroxy-2-carboxylate deaminase
VSVIRAVNRWFFPLSGLDTHVTFVQSIKLAVQEVGLDKEWVREPQLPLVGAERDRVLAVINAGITGRHRLD